jgi:hypothetical protein
MSSPLLVRSRPSSSSLGRADSERDPVPLGAHCLLSCSKYFVKAAVLAVDGVMYLMIKSLHACMNWMSAAPR